MVLVQTDDDDTEHVIYYLSRNLLDTEARYAYVEKLALAVVCVVQRFRHYILLRTTTVISDCNPMTYILSRQLLGEDQIPDETLFLISTLDPWYGDIIIYLQTSSFHPGVSKDARRRIRHQSQPYRIIGDTLYRLGADAVLYRCLTHEEAERVLNDCHSGRTTNNVAEYCAVIELLTEAINLGIRALVVNLDSQLVILQLNRHYSVREHHILRLYLRVRLLERNFEFFTYQHIPRQLNTLSDALANHVLDRHLRNL
eukprot:PITA_13994